MTRCAPAYRGFTLIELIVTISIIVLLAGITVSAMVALGHRSEISRTENSLRLLGMALSEWESNASRKLRWGLNDEPGAPRFDMDENTPHVFTTTELLRTIRRNTATQAVIAQIAPEAVFRIDSSEPTPLWVTAVTNDATDPDPNHDGARGLYESGLIDGEPVVFDAWGTPIRAVHPGRVADPLHSPPDDPDEADPDGTIRTVAEDAYGVAQNQRVLFVSAGPDKLFGMHGDEETEAGVEAEDNLHSYEPGDPTP